MNNAKSKLENAQSNADKVNLLATALIDVLKDATKTFNTSISDVSANKLSYLAALQIETGLVDEATYYMANRPLAATTNSSMRRALRYVQEKTGLSGSGLRGGAVGDDEPNQSVLVFDKFELIFQRFNKFVYLCEILTLAEQQEDKQQEQQQAQQQDEGESEGEGEREAQQQQARLSPIPANNVAQQNQREGEEQQEANDIADL